MPKLWRRSINIWSFGRRRNRVFRPLFNRPLFNRPFEYSDTVHFAFDVVALRGNSSVLSTVSVVHLCGASWLEGFHSSGTSAAEPLPPYSIAKKTVCGENTFRNVRGHHSAHTWSAPPLPSPFGRSPSASASPSLDAASSASFINLVLTFWLDYIDICFSLSRKDSSEVCIQNVDFTHLLSCQSRQLFFHVTIWFDAKLLHCGS